MKTAQSIRYKKNKHPIISVIIPVYNEEKTIVKVIQEAKKISRRAEVIVVCNGTTDQTATLAKKMNVKVIEFDQRLGYDVGRALGAKHAQGRILLFIDGDIVIPASILRKFCYRVNRGYDIVLNSYSGFRNRQTIHSTSLAKRFLNRLLQRQDLKGSSLTSIPHAMSRKALNKLGGYQELGIPPKAQVKAILHNLKITRGPLVNTAKKNKRRNWSPQGIDVVEEIILGDHLEAIHCLCELKGERGGWPDFNRKRELTENITNASINHFNKVSFISNHESEDQGKTSQVSVIISASNEEESVQQAILNLEQLHPKEIIVVENGSQDSTLEKCKGDGVKCISYPFQLGHDVGRAIGAREASGDILLFLDADIVFKAEELRPFIVECMRDTDIVLNNLNPFYISSAMIDYVSMAKSYLNHILQRSDLGYSSLTAVPHAMKKTVADEIGYPNLAVPPKAQAIAMTKKFNVQHVHGVNVLERNKRKQHNHRSGNLVENMILGDHIEAIQWLQKQKGKRVYFNHNR